MNVQHVTFHVGMPRTGSSYLQTMLALNQKALRSAGYWFPSGRSFEKQLDGRVQAGNLDLSDLRDSIEKLVNECPKDCHTLLISSEGLFSRLATSDLPWEQIARSVGKRTANFVCFVRDPLPLSTSSYQQGVKRHGKTFYLSERLAAVGEPKLSQVLELHRKGTRFGHKLAVGSYSSPIHDSDSDLWDVFLKLAGVDIDGHQWSRPGSHVINRSLTFGELEIQRAANRIADWKSHWFISDAFTDFAPMVPVGSVPPIHDDDYSNYCRKVLGPLSEVNLIGDFDLTLPVFQESWENEYLRQHSAKEVSLQFESFEAFIRGIVGTQYGSQACEAEVRDNMDSFFSRKNQLYWIQRDQLDDLAQTLFRLTHIKPGQITFSTTGTNSGPRGSSPQAVSSRINPDGRFPANESSIPTAHPIQITGSALLDFWRNREWKKRGDWIFQNSLSSFKTAKFTREILVGARTAASDGRTVQFLEPASSWERLAGLLDDMTLTVNSKILGNQAVFCFEPMASISPANALGAGEILEHLIEMRKSTNVFSLVRLGHSEIVLLGYPHRFDVTDIQGEAMTIFGEKLVGSELCEFTNMRYALLESAVAATVLGTLAPTTPGQAAERSGLIRNLISPMVLKRLGLPHQGQVRMPAGDHLRIGANPRLLSLFDLFDRLVVVSPHLHLRPLLAEKTKARVSQLTLAGEVGLKNSRGVRFKERILSYKRLGDAATQQADRNTLFLMGGGIPGKALSAQLLQRGASVLDLGSVLDGWMGVATRGEGWGLELTDFLARSPNLKQ